MEAAKKDALEKKTVETEKPKVEETPTGENDQFYNHPVLSTDTLVGISLKYNIPVSFTPSNASKAKDIQRANKLTSQQIYHKKVLLIPKSSDFQFPTTEPDTRTEILRSFRSKTSMSTEDAKFYLEEAEYNLEKALKHWADDEAWAKNNPTTKGSQEVKPAFVIKNYNTPKQKF